MCYCDDEPTGWTKAAYVALLVCGIANIALGLAFIGHTVWGITFWGAIR